MSLPARLRITSERAYNPLPSDEIQSNPDDNYLDADEEVVTTLHDSTSPWRFVESGWFQITTVLVIVSNLVVMIVQTKHPETKRILALPDMAMLCFYIFELVSRACYFQARYCGSLQSAIWNFLDIIVVLAGVLDQWFLPIVQGNHEATRLQGILQILRCLRLVRVLKIIRIFLESDLSWTESSRFQSFIGVVIAFNSILMGMETDVKWAGWFFIEQLLLAVYVFELGALLKRFGFFFFSCSNPDIVWNLLDFTIVVTSGVDSWVMPMAGFVKDLILDGLGHKAQKGKEGMSLGEAMMLMRMMRLMRILRLVKLVKAIRPLYILITSVLAALQGVAWVLVLTVVVLYAMGIVSTRLIGQGMIFPDDVHVNSDIVKPFATVPTSMFTLFRVMSGATSDEEAAAIDELMAALPSVKFAFVFFMVTSSWTLLSILTAVVSENMISTTGEQENEMRLASAEQDRALQVQELEDIFKTIDVSRDGLIEEAELENFFRDKDNTVRCARVCRVPARDVKEVFNDLNADGRGVDMGRFTECLVDVGKAVTEKSVMKIIGRMDTIQQQLDDVHSCCMCGQLPVKSDGATTPVKDAAWKEADSQELNGVKGIEMQSCFASSQTHQELLGKFHIQERTSQELLCSLTLLRTEIHSLNHSVGALVQQAALSHRSAMEWPSDPNGCESIVAVEPKRDFAAKQDGCKIYNSFIATWPQAGIETNIESQQREDGYLEKLKAQLEQMVDSITVQLTHTKVGGIIKSAASGSTLGGQSDLLATDRKSGSPFCSEGVSQPEVRAQSDHFQKHMVFGTHFDGKSSLRCGSAACRSKSLTSQADVPGGPMSPMRGTQSER